MKQLTRIVLICLLLTSIGSINYVKAQEGFLDILYASQADANQYANSYFAPLFKGLGYGFNNGWYNTAKPHKTLGFDLTISANLAYIPGGEENFTFRNEDYETMRLVNGTEAQSPTLFGPDDPGPSIEVPFDTLGMELILATFSGPNGAGLQDAVGFNAVPSPIIQFGNGIFKGTDVKVRYIPDLWKDGDYSIWGIGVMHDIGQWIPVAKKLPVDLSIFGAYSSLSADIPIDAGDNQNFPGDNQSINTTIKGYTIEALVSKKISVLTVLVGVGYNQATTSLDVLGTYKVDYPGLPDDVNAILPALEHPIAISTKENSMRFTGGLRLQFAIVTLHANYTFNGYNLLNTGIGFTFR